MCNVNKWKNTIIEYKNNRPIIVKFIKFIIVALLCLLAFNTIKYRFEVYQGKKDIYKAEEARKELNRINSITAVIDQQKELKKKQIIAITTHGFTVMFNAAEQSEFSTHINSMTIWAKAEGFDGIVAGRIQPSHLSSEMMLATYDGKNAVPLDYAIEKLKDAGATNVVSFMSNRCNFWLPHPFTQQIDGVLNIYMSKGRMSIFGWSFFKSKLKLASNNFHGTIESNVIDGQFDKPLKK